MSNKPGNMVDLREAIAKLEFKPTISNESLMSIQSTDSTTNPLDEAWMGKNKRKRPMSSSELRDSIPLSDSSDDDDIKAELKRITPNKRRKVTVKRIRKKRDVGRKKKTRRKRRKKRDEGKAIERQVTIDEPLIIGHVYLFTPEHANNNSLPIEGALTNRNTGIEGVYQFLVGYRILNNKPNTDIIAVNRERNLGLGRRKKKTRRKRRKKRDEAGCIPWRRRKKKKTKKSKPSIEEIIFELEKSNNPIDKKIAKELNLTLHGWR